MNININKILTVTHYKAVLISTVLTLLLTPLFWVISDANINWILFANIISFTGTLILIYPFITYVYPYMVTKITTFLLTSLLTIVSIWINITAIAFALPHYYIYEATLNATIEKVLTISTGYIVAINTITLSILYQERKIESFF
jgi:hypothetical protein